MGNLISISDNTTLIGADPPVTVRAPEIEAGVGCDFDSYLLVPDNTLADRIAAAKARLRNDVVILGHHYQPDEVVNFADFRGDSHELSSLLDPGKIVPVTYMNSTAAIKAFTGEQGGSICTSSNAAAVMKWAFERGEKVLFLPDEHLGRNTGYRMGIPLERMIVWDPYQEFGGNTPEAIRNARIILWKGYCSVHQRFTLRQVERIRREHPGIRVIVHPECRFEVAQAADEIGSTEGIIKAITASPAGTEWAVGTEIHLVNRLGKEFRDRKVISLDPSVCVCTTMFRITPQHLLWALENLGEGHVVNRISVDERTRHYARVALDRMLSLR